jgi:lysylphosphatidylglycerol synthetase-like protein (DUF2156 family)
MKPREFNWAIWAGFLLSLIAFLSYPFVFVWFPVTRDFPWANFVLFAFSAALLVVGVRRAFAAERTRPRRSKIAGVFVAAICLAIFGLFIVGSFILARQLPASLAAPQVGQKAPDFTLTDTNVKPVALSELLSLPVNGKAPKGVLLVFYRGYW